MSDKIEPRRPHYYVSGTRTRFMDGRAIQIMEEGREQVCIALVPYHDRTHEISYRDANLICAALNAYMEKADA